MVKVQALSIKVSQGARGNWLTWDFGPVGIHGLVQVLKNN